MSKAEKPIEPGPVEKVRPTPESVSQEIAEFFSTHVQQMTENHAEFKEKRNEVRRDIKSGARRTNGRIV